MTKHQFAADALAFSAGDAADAAVNTIYKLLDQQGYELLDRGEALTQLISNYLVDAAIEPARK